MIDLKAIQERAEKMTLARDATGWVPILGNTMIAHFTHEEDAKLFVEGIPMLLKALAEAETKLEAAEEWLEVHGPSLDYKAFHDLADVFRGDAILGGSE